MTYVKTTGILATGIKIKRSNYMKQSTRALVLQGIRSSVFDKVIKLADLHRAGNDSTLVGRGNRRSGLVVF
jgi:HSP20 family molecular chaperone IbpA